MLHHLFRGHEAPSRGRMGRISESWCLAGVACWLGCLTRANKHGQLWLVRLWDDWYSSAVIQTLILAQERRRYTHTHSCYQFLSFLFRHSLLTEWSRLLGEACMSPIV